MESLKEQIYNLYNAEISNLLIGYALNKDRVKAIIDLIARDVRSSETITEVL